MLSNIVQKLNKSLTSPNSDVTEQSPIKSKKPCKLCKGAGCCILCDRPDGWENMVYCSNKDDGLHLLHHSCDNLTPEMVKLIKNYYCPNCRADGQFEVTFYKKASAAKISEISDILNLEKIGKTNEQPLKKPGKNPTNLNLESAEKQPAEPHPAVDLGKDEVEVGEEVIELSKDGDAGKNKDVGKMMT